MKQSSSPKKPSSPSNAVTEISKSENGIVVIDLEGESLFEFQKDLTRISRQMRITSETRDEKIARIRLLVNRNFYRVESTEIVQKLLEGEPDLNELSRLDAGKEDVFL